jgi:microcystin degradation protein MlrC
MSGAVRSGGAPRRKRLAVARFWYEGNAFAPLPADQAAFERYEWRSGAQALSAAQGTATELGAVVDFAKREPDWEVVTLRCASALPAGPIDDAVFERFADEVREGLAGDGWDAVYLSLHGAAITATRQTPELDFVRAVRDQVQDVPIGASFDLHGNLAPELASLLDVVSVYRTHPHVDMAATAKRVLDDLVRCAAGTLKTQCVLRNDGLLLPSFNMRTDAGPMRELEDAAREATTGAIREVGVLGGFPYSDTVHTGASVFVVTDAARDPDGAGAAQVADAMMERIRRLAPQFHVRLPSPREAIASALAIEAAGTVAVTDPADNPLSGGGGDTPGLFRSLLEARVGVPALFASFADPSVVAAARRAAPGGSLEVTLGARYGKQFGEAVTLRATVERLTDGVFRNVGPMENGVERRFGGSALLVADDQSSLRVIVTDEVVPADDPAFYALHGIDPASLRLLCVKAKNHFRAAFAPRCAAIIDCDAPGPACLDLSKLPFKNARVTTP